MAGEAGGGGGGGGAGIDPANDSPADKPAAGASAPTADGVGTIRRGGMSGAEGEEGVVTAGYLTGDTVFR